MIRFLIRRLIPQYQETHLAAVRIRYTMLAGILGLLCNSVLFSVKLAVGAMIGSAAVTADAFNNLSDSGSSLISMIGARLAGQRPDRTHPFGHGRLEYIASLAVSFVILHVGLDQMRRSAEQILHPEEVPFQPVLIVILVLSVLLKLWMWSYYRYIGNTIQSQVLRTTASDSLCDVFASGATVLAAAGSSIFPQIPLDGIMGAMVSLLILKAGWETAGETLTLLLGSAPDPEIARAIERIADDCKGILSVHDLVVHDYGPGRKYASIDAEVSDALDLRTAHEYVDMLEQRIMQELGIDAVVHTDPVTLGDQPINVLLSAVEKEVRAVCPSYAVHDFRFAEEEYRINLIFDLAVPIGEKPECTGSHIKEIRDRIQALNPRYFAIIRMDAVMDCIPDPE